MEVGQIIGELSLKKAAANLKAQVQSGRIPKDQPLTLNADDRKRFVLSEN